MFSEEQLRAYRSVKAPEFLLDAVLTSSREKEPRPNTSRWLLPLMAACLMLCVSLVFLTSRQSPVSVFLDGSELVDAVTLNRAEEKALRRSAPALSLPLELHLREETEISVSHGALHWEENEPTDTLIAKDKVSLVWFLPSEGDFVPCRMELKSKRSTTVIELRLDEKTGEIIAEKSEQ